MIPFHVTCALCAAPQIGGCHDKSLDFYFKLTCYVPFLPHRFRWWWWTSVVCLPPMAAWSAHPLGHTTSQPCSKSVGVSLSLSRKACAAASSVALCGGGGFGYLNEAHRGAFFGELSLVPSSSGGPPLVVQGCQVWGLWGRLHQINSTPTHSLGAGNALAKDSSALCMKTRLQP